MFGDGFDAGLGDRHRERSAMFRIPAISLMLMLLGATVQAQMAAPNVRQACAADAARICGAAPRGHRGACMRAHCNQVSPDCKSAIAPHRDAMRAARSGAPSTPPP